MKNDFNEPRSFWIKRWFEDNWQLIAVVGLIALLLWIMTLPTEPDSQLKKLESMSQQLEKIRTQNDEMIKVLNDIKTQSQSKPLSQQAPKKTISGNASTYSEQGCLGCDKDRIMANGQPLDDDRRTVAIACRYDNGRCRLAFGLGTEVKIINAKTGVAAVATATDTFGGIHGRIADLSLATAQAVGCTGTPCAINITQ